MTLEEFKIEMERLTRRFDKKYYPREVLERIWNESKDLPHFWLKRFVTDSVGSHKPPLLPEFKEGIRLERNRLRQNTPVPRGEEYNHVSIFTPEQRRLLFKIIKLVAARRIPNQEEFVRQFTEDLQTILDSQNRFNEAKTLFDGAREYLGEHKDEFEVFDNDFPSGA